MQGSQKVIPVLKQEQHAGNQIESAHERDKNTANPADGADAAKKNRSDYGCKKQTDRKQRKVP